MSAFIRCRIGASSMLEKLVSCGTDSRTEFCVGWNISLDVVASVDGRTLPLVLLQPNRVYLVVGDVSEHRRDVSCSADTVRKTNSPCVDVSFRQLMIHLAQLQCMLVSVLLTVSNFYLTE